MEASDDSRLHGRALLRHLLQSEHPDKEEVRRACLQELKGNIPVELRADVWMVLLGVSTKDRFLLDDSIRDTKQDLHNQRVIRVDTNRTRANLPLFRTEETKSLVARLLTFYCKRRGIKYKQGLNEVLAPFLILRPSPRLPDGVVFNLFYSFVDRFLPHMYCDEDFLALQCTLRLFRLLLQYHDPELCHQLDQYNLVPELYATPWFLTLFARNVPLELLFEVWDFYLLHDKADGRTLHFYHCVAFVLINREAILSIPPSDLPIFLTSVLGQNSTDKSSGGGNDDEDASLEAAKTEEVLKAVSEIHTLSSREDIKRIFELGAEIKDSTPGAVTAEMYRILFHPVSTTSSEVEHLESLPCLLSSAKGVMARPPEEVVLLDCRPLDEFELAHIENAFHLDPELLSRPEALTSALSQIRKASENRATDSVHYVVFGCAKQDEKIETMFILHLLQSGLKHVSKLKGQWEALRPLTQPVCGPPKVALYNTPLKDASLQDSGDSWMSFVVSGLDKTKDGVLSIGESSKAWLKSQSQTLSTDFDANRSTVRRLSNFLPFGQPSGKGSKPTQQRGNQRPSNSNSDRSKPQVPAKNPKKQAQAGDTWVTLHDWATFLSDETGSQSVNMFDARKASFEDRIVSIIDETCILAVGNGFIYELEQKADEKR